MALLGGERLPPWPLDLVRRHFDWTCFFVWAGLLSLVYFPFFYRNFVTFLDVVFGLWFLDLALLRHRVLFLLLFLWSITVFYVERKNNFLKYFLWSFPYYHLHQARSSCFYIDREHKPLLLKVNREFVVTTNRNLCSNQEFGDRGWTTLFLEDFQLYGLVREDVDVLLRYDCSTPTSQELE